MADLAQAPNLEHWQGSARGRAGWQAARSPRAPPAAGAKEPSRLSRGKAAARAVLSLSAHFWLALHPLASQRACKELSCQASKSLPLASWLCSPSQLQAAAALPGSRGLGGGAPPTCVHRASLAPTSKSDRRQLMGQTLNFIAQHALTHIIIHERSVKNILRMCMPARLSCFCPNRHFYLMIENV